MPDDDKTRLPEDSNGSESLSPGQAFGQYKVIRLLGRGGMGEVYEVEHVELATRHALKLIKQEISDRENVRQRFRREAQVMARLRHENVVQVDDYGETDGRVWLRMELVCATGATNSEDRGQTTEASSLADLMNGESLPEDLVVNLLKQILGGLSYAHGQGVVHRDLKPSNILLQSPSENLSVDLALLSGSKKITAKISDFGLVSVVGADWLQSQIDLTEVTQPLYDSEATRLPNTSGRGSSSRALIGTYHYMSPEQKRGDVVGVESDLYALGLIAFQLLTGEQNLGLELPSQLRPSLSKKWDEWISRSIRSKPEQRYQSAQEMLSAMPLARGKKSLRLPLLSAISVLCLAVVGGYLLFTNSQAPSPVGVQDATTQASADESQGTIEPEATEAKEAMVAEAPPVPDLGKTGDVPTVKRDYLEEAERLLAGAEGVVEIEQVINLLEKASQEGSAEAANQLGDLYYEAELLEQDFDFARKWYEKAVAQDYAPAIDNLGVLYSNGEGVEKDEERAFELFSRAAEAGDLKGRHNLAIAYLEGSGTEKDPKRAIGLLEKTAEEGMARSALVLSGIYENGIDGSVEADPEKAFDYALAASDSDLPSAWSQLGYLYASGIGVEQDMVKAIQMWQKAAEADEPLAQNNLGAAYLEGNGVAQDNRRGLQLIRAAADQGLPLAQYNLAVQYENGNELDQDFFKAAYYYERAAEAGHADALNNLGGLHEFGEGVDKDTGAALEMYRNASEQGSANATYNLGRFYLQGIEVKKDAAKAVEFFKPAAARGVVDAAQKLGLCYEFGEGVSQDYKEAFKWYKRAADAGSVFAQMNLGFLYLNGNGVTQDLVRAAELIEPAAQKGELIAATQLGEMYEKGLGVPVDLGKAKEYYTIAAEAGGSFAMTELGIMYQNGRGVPKDASTALEYFKEATDLGDMRAAFLAATVYSEVGSEVFDINEAVQLYKRASDAGVHNATFQLAWLYLQGEDVDQDDERAFELMQTGAEAGDASCQWGLGYIYNLGKGVKRNGGEAIFWYRRSAEQGDPSGQSSLASMYYYGAGTKKDYAEAAKWNKLAAEQGDIGAQFFLGEQYRKGQGVERDENQALHWYKRAADGGHVEAALKYKELLNKSDKSSARKPFGANTELPEVDINAAMNAGSVLFVHIRAPGHHEKGQSTHYEHIVEQISEVISGNKIRLANDRVDVALLFRSTTKQSDILLKAKETGASHLLLLTVDRPLTQWVEATLDCYHLGEGLIWSIDTKNATWKWGMAAVKDVTKELVESFQAKLKESPLPAV